MVKHPLTFVEQRRKQQTLVVNDVFLCHKQIQNSFQTCFPLRVLCTESPQELYMVQFYYTLALNAKISMLACSTSEHSTNLRFYLQFYILTLLVCITSVAHLGLKILINIFENYYKQHRIRGSKSIKMFLIESDIEII